MLLNQSLTLIASKRHFGAKNSMLLLVFYLLNSLDQFYIYGFPVGFWFAQQGSIYVFVILIFVYVRLMNKLDDTIEKEFNKSVNTK